MSSVLAVHPFRSPAAAAATIICDDAATTRQLSRVLGEAGFNITVAAAWETLQRDSVRGQLVVIATQQTDAARIAATKAIAEAHPDARLLIVMPPGTRAALLRRALVSGAHGIVVEDEVERVLAASARTVLLGQLAVPETLGRQIAPTPLSHREKQILSLVVRGRTNREIAQELFLAESTVKTHLSSAFRKLDARSRAEAVARIQDPEFGYGMGVLDPAEAGAP